MISCLLPLAVFYTLVLYTDAERCSYRARSDLRWESGFGRGLALPTEMAFKDCTWGCCWDKKDDVCCSFPMDVVVFAFIVTLAAVVVFTLVIILMCYINMRRHKNNIEAESPILREAGFLGYQNDRIFPHTSTLLQNGYPNLHSNSTRA